jgi:hypothetical protein
MIDFAACCSAGVNPLRAAGSLSTSNPLYKTSSSRVMGIYLLRIFVAHPSALANQGLAMAAPLRWRLRKLLQTLATPSESRVSKRLVDLHP